MPDQRPPANRMSLQTFKARLGGAVKGFKLLKKKRDALKAKFNTILKSIVQTKLSFGKSILDANFAFAKANWAMTEDMTSTVIGSAGKPSITCQLYAENTAGVSMPSFKMKHDPSKDQAYQSLGIHFGGAVVKTCQERYHSSVKSLIELASLQTQFVTLDEEIKMTSRRVNALEYVLIPKIEEVIAYIIQEMDEQAREEFFRVKKVVEKKKQRIAREKLLVEAEAAAAGAAKGTMQGNPAVVSALEMNGAAKDEDIVFT